MSSLRGSHYIDRRTASNVVNMADELRNVAVRLRLFGFASEAAGAEQLAGALAEFGIGLAHTIGDQRLRVTKEDKVSSSPSKRPSPRKRGV
jgi:hypothetical protein